MQLPAERRPQPESIAAGVAPGPLHLFPLSSPRRPSGAFARVFGLGPLFVSTEGAAHGADSHSGGNARRAHDQGRITT
jgi:hypothetical protein